MSNAIVGPRTTHPMEESQLQTGNEHSTGNIWILLDTQQTILNKYPLFAEFQGFQYLDSWEVKGRGRERRERAAQVHVPMGVAP